VCIFLKYILELLYSRDLKKQIINGLKRRISDTLGLKVLD
jgi:hypothetical protein